MQNEKFIQDIPLISELKLRASYGEIGNQEIGDYQYGATSTNPYTHAVFSNQLAIGATQRIATPDIKWESKKSTNIGVDVGLMATCTHSGRNGTGLDSSTK